MTLTTFVAHARGLVSEFPVVGELGERLANVPAVIAGGLVENPRRRSRATLQLYRGR
jgi:hypothetical protein